MAAAMAMAGTSNRPPPASTADRKREEERVADARRRAIAGDASESDSDVDDDELDDIDLVIAHQANARIVEAVRKRLGADPATVPMNMDRYGNTTAGTLPILYHEQRAAGRVPPGTTVCFTAFGAGAHFDRARWPDGRR